MRGICIGLLLLVALAGCEGLMGPSSLPVAGVEPTKRRPEPAVCVPGGEAYAARIQGFPEYRDTTFCYLQRPLDSWTEADGPISHPLIRWQQTHVVLDQSPDTCRWLAVANQIGLASPFTIFPTGSKYSQWQLTGTAAETDLARGFYECDWLGSSNTESSLVWAGQPLGRTDEPNWTMRKAGWILVVNEQDLESECPVVNALHLYGPGHREVIVSHIRAIPICP